ncbi:uncharacterized protein LOC34618015 [Cyclospora cayetanensis]|uniref:Uncharacterized protein LOC34618015 n=1 Tax=Cyclospora cayetanensis TaxID=88456 RepID=A0A6P6RPY8_9EIME|nr:uncharacterized protein LOC34618015 [Cyclospora cayetanensis]
MVLLHSLVPSAPAAAAAAAAATASKVASPDGAVYRKCYVCGRSSSSMSSMSSMRRWFWGYSGSKQPNQRQRQQQQKQQQLGRCSREDMQSILHQAVRRLEMLQKQKAEAKGIATPFMDYGRLEKRWSGFLSSVEAHGKLTCANFIKVYSNGDATLRAMLDSIASAERFVFLESYIFDASQAAAAVKEALKAAAARGCLVILLIDGVGSFGFPSNWISELVKSGVHVTIFNPPLPAAFYAPAAEATTPPLAEAAKRQGSLHAAKVGPLALRDHRKTLVVDGKEAFVGSFNISVDTTGPSVGGTGHFQDLHVRLCGPAATDLGLVFHQSLHAAQAESLAAEALQQLQQVLESDILKNRRCIQEALQLAIQTASRSLHLGTAYFMPPGFLRRALLQQIRSRHTDVLLLLSGDSDVWCDFPATTYLAHKLLAARERSRPLQDWLLLRNTAATVEMQQQQLMQQEQEHEQDTAPAAGGLARLLPPWTALSRLQQSRTVFTSRPPLLPREGQSEQQQQQQQQQAKKPFVHSFTTEDPCEGSGADASVPSSRPLYRLLRFLRGGNTPEVLRGELRIHFTRDKHYHAKNLVADCLWACIGSFNFDRFSSRRNLEVSIGVLGGSVAWELAELQEKQAAGAPQFFLETWRELGPLRRAMCFFAYHIMKFTGKNIFDGLSSQRDKETLSRSIKQQNDQQAALPAIATQVLCGC